MQLPQAVASGCRVTIHQVDSCAFPANSYPQQVHAAHSRDAGYVLCKLPDCKSAQLLSDAAAVACVDYSCTPQHEVGSTWLLAASSMKAIA